METYKDLRLKMVSRGEPRSSHASENGLSLCSSFSTELGDLPGRRRQKRLFANSKSISLRPQSLLPPYLQGLRAYAVDPNIDPRLIIYHLGFMPLHLISKLYEEVFRILRRELSALGEDAAAYAAIHLIDKNLGTNV